MAAGQNVLLAARHPGKRWLLCWPDMRHGVWQTDGRLSNLLHCVCMDTTACTAPSHGIRVSLKS